MAANTPAPQPTEEEKKPEETTTTPNTVEKPQESTKNQTPGVAKQTEKTREEMVDMYKKTAEMNKEFAGRFEGEHPTSEGVLTKLKALDMFKDVNTYEDALNIIKNGKKGPDGKPTDDGKNPNLGSRLEAHVNKQPDKVEIQPQPAPSIEDMKAALQAQTSTPQSPRPEPSENETKIIPMDNSTKVKTSKKGFRKGVGNVVKRPFQTTWRLGRIGYKAYLEPVNFLSSRFTSKKELKKWQSSRNLKNLRYGKKVDKAA